MNKLLLLSLFCFSVIAALAQNNPPAYFVDRMNLQASDSRIDTNSRGEVILVSEYKNRNVRQVADTDYTRMYLGTPFFENGWYQGKVVLQGSEPVEGLMAFDLNKNVVYYSPGPNKNSVELRPTDFTIKGKKFSQFKDEFTGAGAYYYETLVYGEVMLLKQYECTYVQTKSDVDNGYGSGQTSPYEGEYKKTEKLYLVVENALNLVKNKKVFYNSLGKHSDKAREYASKNKLNLNKEEDVIQLARHLSGENS